MLHQPAGRISRVEAHPPFFLLPEELRRMTTGMRASLNGPLQG